MALQVVGVRLVADDGAVYIATLQKAENAEERLAKGAKGAADGLNFMERAAKGAAERVGHLATDALADAGRAVLKFAADGVKAAGDFESGMNNFAAAAGGALAESGQSLDQFSDLFLQLGRDLPVSTQEVQQAAIEMAKGGIEPATIAAGGLERVLKFAAANGLELADAATIASKTIGGWTAVNASAADKATFLAAATDLMTRAAGAASVNVDDLALGLYNAQGKAKSAGVSFAETVTTITALAPGFASSAEAGNSFKNFLSRIIPETEKATSAMAELGLLTKDGTSAFYDANGAFIGMERAAGLLSKATKGLTQAEKSEYLQRIFGNDAMGSAVRLAELGADGYHQLAESIAKQNGVAEQAAKKQQGWNVALDNMGGSLEALQITMFSKALPAITGLVNIVAKGINTITAYADATAEGNTALAEIASVVSTLATPALIGLAAATTAYAVASGIAAIGGVSNLGLALALLAQQATLAAGGIAAAAGATALAALPFVAIGAAIGVTVLKFNEFNASVTSAADAVLNSRPWWTDSAAAIEDYGNQTKEAAEKLQPLADNITLFRDTIHGELEELGKREAAYQAFGVLSGFTREQLDAELVSINQHNEGLIVATKAYNDGVTAIGAQEQALLREQAAAITATSVTSDLAEQTQGLGAQASLTEEDIQKLTEKIADISEKGGAALQSYASAYSTFFADVETRQAAHTAKIEELEQKKGEATTADQKQAIDDQIAQANQAYSDQEAAAAASYVRQQADQKRHLGQMLLDYTVTQATLATTDEGRRDRLLEVARAVEQEYGLQESSTASTFLAMTRSIDSFSKDSGEDINALITKLHEQEDQARATQKAGDDYSKTYTANAVANFVDRKGEADDYIDSLEAVPELVSSAMELPNIDDRIDEIKEINRGLAQTPRTVTIHIQVKDDVPPEYKPGSPTPFEMGIRGIIKAVKELSGTSVTLPKIDDGLADVQDGLGGVSDDISQLLDQSDAPDDAYGLGEDVLTGLARGISQSVSAATDAARAAMQDVISEMEDAWDSHSPSRVAAQIGRDAQLGLAQGFTDNTGLAVDAAAQSADQVAAALAAAFADLDVPTNLLGALGEDADGVLQILDQISGVIADIYDAQADLLNQQEKNLGDLDKYSADTQATVQAQLAQAQQEANQFTDPAQAAQYYQMRSKQIFALADLEKDREDAAAGVADKIKEQTGGLDAQIAALQEERKTATDPAQTKELDAMIFALQNQRQRQVDQITAEATRRIDERIALLRQAQAAEQAAYEQRRQHETGLGNEIQDILDIWDNLGEEGDLPPDVAAFMDQLYHIISQLGSLGFAATGGTLDAMRPYVVGERGPEMIVPGVDSYALTAQQTRQAMQPAPMGGSQHYGGATINLGGITINGSGLGESALRGAIFGAVNDAARASDLRIRMGVS